MKTDPITKLDPAALAAAQAALAADAAALQQDQVATRRANAEPLPGPLALAFTPDELQLLGFTIRPVVAGDFIMLKRLNSPLYQRTFELAEHARKIAAGEISQDTPAPAPTPYDDDECVEMIFQFTRPLPEIRELWRKGTSYNPDGIKGRDDVKAKADQRAWFREQALQAVMDRPPFNVARLVLAVVANFTAAFSTAVKYEGESAEGAETVFTTPAAASATASAGGSTTSPASPAAIPPRKSSS